MGERFRLQLPICGHSPVDVKVKIQENPEFFGQEQEQQGENPKKHWRKQANANN
jgi:hypothetical protein